MAFGNSPADNPATNVSSLATALFTESGIWRRFDIVGQVTYPVQGVSKTLVVSDGVVCVPLVDNIYWPQRQPFAFGDLIHVTGHVESNPDGTDKAICLSIAKCGKGPPIPVEAPDFYQLLGNRFLYHTVRVSGRVREAFRDEIDRSWAYLVLKNEGRTCCVVCQPTTEEFAALPTLVDAEIEVTGLNQAPRRSGNRKHAGPLVMIPSLDSIHVKKAANANPFAVPELNAGDSYFAETIAEMGRRRVTGRVFAIWSARRLLVLTDQNRIIGIDLDTKDRPAWGETIEAVGFPETDLYRINLTKAVWRKAAAEIPQSAPGKSVTGRDLMEAGDGQTHFNSRYHGRSISMVGLIRAMPSHATGECRILLECDGYLVSVDVGCCPEALTKLSVGSRIKASGVCIMETDSWRDGANFPRAHGFLLTIRSGEDILVLSNPPWWTPFRAVSVLGIMLAVIVLVLIWNRSLRRLAERRGDQLAQEKVARRTSDLKVRERTRLAVELHDALAQNLTGASMQIRTAGRIFRTDVAGATQYLSLAMHTLDSCREDLRNCIWDLRNDALESDDMEDAIMKTLKLHADGTKISIRFNVPRSRLSDNTMHTLLCIIRELVTNAFRHGHAKNVKIAGSVEGQTLRFSVRDNGLGFETETLPGMADGHFGLQGIRERISRYNGEMSIRSAPGKGTKATVSLKLTDNSQHKDDIS